MVTNISGELASYTGLSTLITVARCEYRIKTSVVELPVIPYIADDKLSFVECSSQTR